MEMEVVCVKGGEIYPLQNLHIIKFTRKGCLLFHFI